MTPYYSDSLVTLYHGDCREVLPHVMADLVVTSPPYNLLRRHSGAGANSIHAGGLWKKMSENWYPDERDEAEYQLEQRDVLRLCREAAPCIAYNHKLRYQIKRMGRTLHPMAWLQEHLLWVEIIWDRGGGPALNCQRPVPADERIFVLGRPVAWHDIGLTTVWRIHPTAQANGHPCPFPEEIPRRLVAMFTDPGHTVLDPYVGSGTTLRVAKDLGRKAIGIELDERYCEIAANRCRQEVLDLGGAA
jgi:site-specific DNA-methyltransferase (adenine-specific)